jgi:hypothetical protein
MAGFASNTTGLPSRLPAAVVLALAVLAPSVAPGADWLSGPALRKRLLEPVSVSWSGSPLRQSLRGLSRAQQVAVLLDRRVDPGRPIEFQLADEPLVEALEILAQREGLDVTLLDGVVYIGPSEATSKLRTLSALRTEEARGLPPPWPQKLLGRKPLAWDDFATPRELLNALAAEAGVALRGQDRVPHDLWAAAEGPPMTWVDRMTLVAAQFDLTFELSPAERNAALVPIPEDLGIVRSYPGGSRPEEVARQYARLVPDAQVRVAAGKVWVKGLLEDHEAIAAPRTPGDPHRTPPAPDPGRRRIDRMSVRDAPVGHVLEQLADQLGLELRIDRAALERAGVSLDERVTVHVENVSIDELFQEVIRTTALRFVRRGNVVEIGPAADPP